MAAAVSRPPARNAITDHRQTGSRLIGVFGRSFRAGGISGPSVPRKSGAYAPTYSSISTNQFLPFFNGARAQMGEIIMGTEGTIEITVGFDEAPCIAWWYQEPPKKVDASKPGEKKPFVAGATMKASGGARGPIPILTSDLEMTGKESFIDKEVKFARRMLMSKGIMIQEEQHNPVDTELESFFRNCRDGKKPLADVEVGLADSVAVILSNMAMDEGRKVYYNEMEKLGKGAPAKKG